MSDAPTPQTVSPSTIGTSLPPGGTVSRCPASTRRCSRPSEVRATTLSPMRSTSSQEHAPQCTLHKIGDRRLETADRGDGHQVGGDRQQVAHRVQVLAPWSRRTWVNCALSWRSPSLRRLITSTHGTKNSPPGYSRRRLARMATHHGGTTPRRDLLARLGVDDGDRRVEETARPQHRSLADACPTSHHAAAADEGVVFYHDGHRIGWFEHTADPHPSSEMHALADLRAGGDRRPGVDHGARPDPGADVDVGGHQHDTSPEEGTPTRRGPRQGTHARLGKSVLQGQLVGVLERAQLDRLHAAQREQQEDRLLQPLVDDDLVADRVYLGHPGLAGVEKVDRLLDQLRRVAVGRTQLVPPLPQLLDAAPGDQPWLTLARRSPTNANRSIGWTTATRTCESPFSP